MSDAGRVPRVPRLTLLLAIGVATSAAMLVWLGYRAVSGWRQSASSLSQRRAQDTVDLLARALARDMRGAQARVLSSPQLDEFMLDTPHDVVRIVAGAFARYPYPESFFAWRAGAKPVPTVFFTRADRPPRWLPADSPRGAFPVAIVDDPPLAPVLLDRIRRDAQRGRRFCAFELALGPSRYQVVARLLYRDALREQLEAVFGFTVDLAWVRDGYFPEVVRQVARISGAEGPVLPAIVDARDVPLTQATAGPSRGHVARRSFALAFFDPSLVELYPPDDLALASWAVEVRASDDPALGASLRGANRALALAALAAGALALGLGLTLRAARTSARLAAMRSEFVATVTHELKTPIATIRALGDTLVAGRVSDPAARHEYARLVVQEAKRLARLIDNLLAYARVTDVADVYHFEAISLPGVVEDVLAGFRTQLDVGGFEVVCSMPADLPAVRADRTALGLLLENLVDNAIRYSRAEHRLEIVARPVSRGVEVSVSDRGEGIPADELDKVTLRFFRGRSAGASGSGLGLAIARRIAEDHAGELVIASEPGRGTSVSVRLKLAP